MHDQRFVWQYNPRLKQWETTAAGWRGIVARWANRAEWTAAIEPLGDPAARRTASHVFLWMEDAQAWCAAMLGQVQPTS
jgi:hypothetical protein